MVGNSKTINMQKKLLAFDLDDTLAISKSPITNRMGRLLIELSGKYQILIITGGTFNQIKTQIIDELSKTIDNLNPNNMENFHLMPTCGTAYYIYKNNDWNLIYSENLTEEQKKEAILVLENTAKKYNIWLDNLPNYYGQIIEDRGSQITYSALGQSAPPDKKYEWKKKNNAVKQKVRDEVSKLLPTLEVKLGGSTSIDITLPGIDKAYGMNKLIDILKINKESILFFGDNFEKGGNDTPVKDMGVDCIEVSKWEDTADILEEILGGK